MPSTLWTAPFNPTGSTAGATVTAAATLTDCTPGPDPYQMPPAQGRNAKLLIDASGEYLTASAPTANVTIGLYIGAPGVAIASAVKLAETAAFAVVNTSAAVWEWELTWCGTVRTLTSGTGTLGTIYGNGRVFPPASISTAGTPQLLPITQALRLVSYDTSTTRQLMLGITLSATTGTPSMNCQHFNPQLIG